MTTGTANRCKLCASNGIDTAMWQPNPGAMPICPKCDRIKCRCGALVLDAKGTKCGHCGDDVTLATFLRRQGRA